jgi:hypothetical protein
MCRWTWGDALAWAAAAAPRDMVLSVDRTGPSGRPVLTSWRGGGMLTLHGVCRDTSGTGCGWCGVSTVPASRRGTDRVARREARHVALLLGIRIGIEEKALRMGLEGYDDCAHRVRCRLLPLIW